MEHSDTTTSDAGAASGLMGRVRDRAEAQLSSQKDRATDGIGAVAQAVRQSAQHLRDNHQDTIARYAEQAADQLERFSNGLRNRDVGEIVEDVQRFARRQPALFVGSAFAIGVIGARFLKSSSDRATHGRGLAGYRASAGGVDHAGRGY